MRHRKTKRGGGWFDSLSFGSSSDTGSSVSQTASDYWNSASNTLSSYNPFKKNATTSTPTSTYMPTSNTSMSYGGRKRRTRRSKRGGSRMTNFPLTPASYEGTSNISYQLVGGKTRRHRKRGRRTRRR